MTIESEQSAASAAPWDIRLENLSVGYGERTVLSDVTVTLPGGRISAVLGESGCGKTTLLRHIIGLDKPLQGRILYGGQDCFTLPPAQFRRIRRRFGVLFQDGALLGSLTLAENVALPLTEHTRLAPHLIRKAVLRTLKLVGLEGFADYYPTELSGGMKKRGGLARAIVTEPPLLFCDEPTSGLDPINAAQMDRLLLNMKAQYPNMTMVVVTHDLASVARIADHVLVLREGRLIFSGSYAELRASSAPYLRRFLDREGEAGEETVLTTPADPEVRTALDAWLAG